MTEICEQSLMHKKSNLQKGANGTKAGGGIKCVGDLSNSNADDRNGALFMHCAAICVPYTYVLAVITVGWLINVSVVITESKDRPEQARCNGQQISFREVVVVVAAG